MKMTDGEAGVVCGFLLLLQVQIAMATEAIDVRQLGQTDKSTPAMAGFYVVNPEGELIAVDPVAAGLATTSSADFSAPLPAKPAAARGSEDSVSRSPAQAYDDQDKPRRAFVRSKRKRPDRSLSKQLQCERHGLYYTNDGRCILPAWSNPRVKPHLLSPPGAVPLRTDR
jgi:hypothetical protein